MAVFVEPEILSVIHFILGVTLRGVTVTELLNMGEEVETLGRTENVHSHPAG